MKVTEDTVEMELRKRNPHALEFVMDYYGRVIYNLIHRILGDIARKEDVEECASDAFVAVWHKIDEYDRKKGSFRTWLLILAKYKALDYRRKLRQHPVTETLEIDPPDDYELEEKLLSQEVLQETVRIINTLQEPDRSLFYKRYFYYESLDQLALQYGLTKKAVENRLFRCRSTLKQHLSQYLRGGSV